MTCQTEPLEPRRLFASVAVDLNDTAQTMESIGGNYSKAPFYDTANDAISQVTLDELKPSIVRVPLLLTDWEPANDNADSASENAGGFIDSGKVNEIFKMMQQYESRGLAIIGAIYNAPDWMVSNPDNVNQRVIPQSNYPELLESIRAMLRRAKDVYGVTLDYLSINEANGGFSLLFSASEMANWIKTAAPALNDAGFPHKWMTGDTYQVKDTAAYAKAILDDPQARPHLGPISFHTWWSETISTSHWNEIRDLGEQYNIPVWATEIGYDATAWFSKPWIFPTWQNASRIATTFHKSIVDAGASAALYWQYQDDFPLMSADTKTKYYAYHVVKQLREHFDAGTQIVAADSDTPNILALAGKHAGENRFSSQLINASDSDQSVTITGLPNQPLTLVRSSKSGEKSRTIATFTPVSGQITLTLKASSVNILSGKLSSDTALPAGWSSTDIGNVGVAGSASASDGVFTINGGGHDMGGTADSLHFAWTTLIGDGEIIARLTNIENTNASAKAAIMIRESLDANAKQTALLVTPGNGIYFQRRKGPGATAKTSLVSASSAPVWLKLSRQGVETVAYLSSDGNNWTPIHSTSTAFEPTVYVGLAVSSRDTGELNTSVFDNVSIGKPAAPQPTRIAAIADAYVRSGVYSSINYGSESTLIVKESNSASNDREIYLRFDLSSVSTISSGKLRLFGALSDTSDSAVATRAYGASLANWSQLTLSWNTRPGITTASLASQSITGTEARWYEWDVSSFLRDEKLAGRSIVTLKLDNPLSSSASGTFNSSEASFSQPELLIT